MADRTFAWPTQATKSGNDSFRYLEAKFGEGYGQTAGDGINTVTDSWNVEIKGLFGTAPGCANFADVKAAREFLREHSGWKAFNWYPPGGPLGEYRCTASSYKQDGNVFSLSATFIRRHGV